MILEAADISKAYTDTAEPVWVLKGLDFKLEARELVGVFGASGAGKSTFLHILGGLDSPSSGNIRSDGKNLADMRANELAQFRNRKVGFVFQFYYLLSEFSAVENVMMPALIAGKTKKEAFELAASKLEAMGLSGRMDHRPAMLSGGEQQRVAIARACVLDPPMILADEPTGNLDTETGSQIIEHLLSLNRQKGMAMVIVTHNRELLARLPKAYELKNGKLENIK